jgi:membrane protein implicated in regulation of membrane protease activity
MSFDTLNCVYLTLFFVGVGYALFIVITGGLSGIEMPDVDIDVPQIDLGGDVSVPGVDVSIGAPDMATGGIDAPDVSVSPLSPITIATFITIFGGMGALSLELLDVDPRWSLLIAIASGLVGSGLMYVFYTRILLAAQSSSIVRRSDLIGLHAEVMVPIGETTPGKVTYVTKTGRMSSMARSIDGSALPRGQFVEIVQTTGPQVLVRPLADMDDDVE